MAYIFYMVIIGLGTTVALFETIKTILAFIRAAQKHESDSFWHIRMRPTFLQICYAVLVGLSVYLLYTRALNNLVGDRLWVDWLSIYVGFVFFGMRYKRMQKQNLIHGR